MNELHEIPVDLILAAAGRSEVIAAMDVVYQELDTGIAAHAPTCWNKGECCRFGEYGHRLYVTALEVAYYLAVQSAEADSAPSPPNASLPVLESRPSRTGDVCPHAHGGRCHVRAARPLGCRIFYCDPAAQHFQGPMTETYLARLRELHDVLNVPYFYADWMTVLRALSESEKVGK